MTDGNVNQIGRHSAAASSAHELDLNQASYELALAMSIVGLTAGDLGASGMRAALPAGHDYSNALFAASDCIRRAKAIIDAQPPEKTFAEEVRS